uniref:ABC transmembrane type-1 domain-containing protein n=1 Tax=Echinostoma caproni TaxID=27848 RepID=A0A183A3X8_9TREM
LTGSRPVVVLWGAAFSCNKSLMEKNIRAILNIMLTTPLVLAGSILCKNLIRSLIVEKPYTTVARINTFQLERYSHLQRDQKRFNCL